jgi:hypothetical protein
MLQRFWLVIFTEISPEDLVDGTGKRLSAAKQPQ